jgi:hypothetical protein
MSCYYHEGKEIEGYCSYCGKALCKECLKQQKGRTICDECLESRKKVVPRRYNSFLAFVFSLVPGAGQMYFGIMSRGLQFMFLFFGIVIIANMSFGFSILNILLVIVWFYSFFDCLHIKRNIDNDEIVEDEQLFDYKSLPFNKYYVGIVLIVFGGIILLQQGLDILSFIDHRIIWAIRGSIFPLILIIIGIILLYKNGRKTEKILPSPSNSE